MKWFLLIATLFISHISFNQTITQDTCNKKSPVVILKKAIVPSLLIGTGLLINNSDFEQNFQTNLRNKVGTTFEFPIDDYVQYAPIVELYLADILGVKSKNHWFDQTKYLFFSNIISSGITHSLKHITNKIRPNGSPESFPSGHTSFAFTNATVLFNEFQQSSPLLAYSGYVFASTTGAFRMINNYHWLSDVLVGAGIGMLSAQLVYYFEPFKKFNPFEKSKNISLLPYINKQNAGLYFTYKL